MDIAQEIARSEEGAVLHLKDVRGALAYQADGTSPVTIKLAGMNSQRWRLAWDIVGNRRLKRVANGRTAANSGVKSVQEARDDRAFLLASATISWEGILVDGKPFEFSHDNAIKLYMMAPFIMDQADEFIAEPTNF